MASKINKLKFVLFLLFLVVFFGWALAASYSSVRGDAVADDIADDMAAVAEPGPTPGGDYVGSQSCKECHEDQFKNFQGTKHSKLKDVPSWKDKVVGCETCHGPGKKHLEDATTPGPIISFKN